MYDSKNCVRLAVGILLRCARSGTRFYLQSWQNVYKEPRDIRKQSIREAFNGRVSFTFTLFFFCKNIVFPAQAEYSYFSADFRLNIFLYYS